MTRATPIVNNFAGGEITPLLDPAADLDWYALSCRLLQNYLVLPQRGACRRGGTRYIAGVKTSASRTTLMPFKFSTVQAYMLEVGGQYFRFFKDKARIVVANTDAAIANGTMTGSLASWTDQDTGSGASTHDATNDRMSLQPGGTGATDIAWREQAVSVGASFQSVVHVLRFRVIGAAGDYIQCRIGTSSTGSQLVADRICRPGWHSISFTPGAATVYVQFRNQGSNNNDFANLNKIIQVDDVSLIDNAALEIGSPYAQADLFDSDGRLRIKFTQSADVLYLTHPDYPVYKLSRSGHNDWALTLLAFEQGPMLDENSTSTQVQVSAATGAAVSLTATSTKGINNGQGFLTTDVGRVVRAKVGGAAYGWGIIVGWTSSTVVTIDVRSTFTTATTDTAVWALGLYSDTDGWPACVMFNEERLIFAGSDGRPNRWDGSASGDFENFTPGSGDSDTVGFSIAADEVNAIRWMVAMNKLLFGTADDAADMMPVLAGGGAGFAASGPNNGVITPSTVEVKRQSSDIALYVQKHGRELREIAFSWESEGYRSESMSIRAPHLMRGGLIQLAWKPKPYGQLFAARKDGMLLAFTYLRSQQITAWQREPIGGTSSTNVGIVESVASIPGTGEDELWLIVRRTINGATARYVEILEEPLDDEEPDQIKAFYVDSGLTYDGAQSTTLTPGAGATVAGTTGVTFTAGSAVFAGTSADVGKELRYRVAADPDAHPAVTAIEARAVVTGFVSTTQVTCRIMGAFPSLSAIAAGAWRLSTLTVTGLDHLEGETVQVLTDGAKHPDKTVSGGAITLDYPATYVHAGLQFKSRLLPTKIEAGAQEGTAQGKTKRPSGITVRLHRTLGLKYGPSEAKLDNAQFRDAGDAMDLAIPLFTGDKKLPFRGNFDTAADILLGQDDPLPQTILAIMPTLATAEGG